MRKVYTIYGFLLLCIGLTVFCLACRHTKELSRNEHITVKRDTDSKIVDTSWLRQTIKDYEAHYKVDTAIGISGSGITVYESVDDAPDTVAKSGNATLTRYTNNKGKRVTKCECDSITLVLKQREIYISRKEAQYDSLRLLYVATHSTTDSTTLKEVVKEQTDNWLGAVWDKVKGFCAWIGVIALIVLVGLTSFNYYKKYKSWR